MSTGHPLFGLTTEERERSLQLKLLLPTLEADLARHYKPYTFYNVVEDPQWTSIALQHVLFRLSTLLSGASCNGEPVHFAWPSFLQKLFWTNSNSWEHALPIRLRYPKLRSHDLWGRFKELHAVATFFVRTYPSPSVYDMMQHFLVLATNEENSNRGHWTPFKHTDEANTTPYNPPFSNEAASQRLYDHLVACHAKVFPRVPGVLNVTSFSSSSVNAVDDTVSSLTAQVFEVVQTKDSGKTTALNDLAEKNMLGVVVNLERTYLPSESDWLTFCRPTYYSYMGTGWDAEREFQCACFVASYMAAISIQLSRLVRQRAQKIRGAGTPAPLTMQQWRTEVVPFVTKSTHSTKWHKQLKIQTRALMQRGTPLTSDDLALTETIGELPSALTTFKTFVPPKKQDEEDGPIVDPVTLFADELKLYLYNESHVDNLASTLVDVLGLNQALGQPLFFCALDDHPELLLQARHVLVRMWQRIQHPSHWLILVGRGVRNDDGRRGYDSDSDKFQKQKLTRPHPLVTLDPFIDLAVDLGWNGLPPSSSAFDVAQLRGVTFAGLECVSLRYGRPLWLANSMIDPTEANFGSISLHRVLTEVLGFEDEEMGQLDRRYDSSRVWLGLRLPTAFLYDQGTLRASSLGLKCSRIASYRYDTETPTRPTSLTTGDVLQVDMEPLQEPVCSAATAYIFRTKYFLWKQVVPGMRIGWDLQSPFREQFKVALVTLLMANDLAHHRQSFGKHREHENMLQQALTLVQPRIDGILEPVTLWNWLELLQSKDSNHSVGVGTLRWMQGQLVNFTHIATTPTTWPANEAIPIGMLVDGWVRQCAWWLSPAYGQKDEHLLVPLHAANEAFMELETARPRQGTLSVHPFEPEALGFVLIRIAAPGQGTEEPDDNQNSEKHQYVPETIKNTSSKDNVFTWSRVQHNETAAHRGPRTVCCSHMVVTIDMQQDGPPVWLQKEATDSGPAKKTGEERQGQRPVQRYDLLLRGGGEQGLLACEALSFSDIVAKLFTGVIEDAREALARKPSQEKSCSEEEK